MIDYIESATRLRVLTCMGALFLERHVSLQVFSHLKGDIPPWLAVRYTLLINIHPKN